MLQRAAVNLGGVYHNGRVNRAPFVVLPDGTVLQGRVIRASNGEAAIVPTVYGQSYASGMEDWDTLIAKANAPKATT
jgi:tRNA G18 (ribose-2'-O)-methylase SpoU